MNTKKRVLTAIVSTRVKPSVKRKLIKIAKEKTVDLADLVREILMEYVDKHK